MGGFDRFAIFGDQADFAAVVSQLSNLDVAVSPRGDTLDELRDQGSGRPFWKFDRQDQGTEFCGRILNDIFDGIEGVFRSDVRIAN